MDRRTLNLLRKIYFNIDSPAAFAGAEKVYKEAKKQIPQIKYAQVKDFLQGESTYTLYHPTRKRFKRIQTVPSGLNTHWQADLAIFDTIHPNNNGNKYLLVCCDVLSRKIYVEPVKSKSSKQMIKAFENIFKKAKTRPWILTTDRGVEFQAKEMMDFYQKNQIIKHVIYTPNIHAGIVERANRTIKDRLYRYFHRNKTHRWVDIIDKIVNSINNSINRTIGVKPNEVTYKNANELRDRVFGNAFVQKINTKFKEGDVVRLVKDKGKFGKGYHPSFTLELFKIKYVKNSIPTHYKLQDMDGNDIKGIYYGYELSPIKYNDTDQKGSGLKFVPIIWEKIII